MAKADADGQPVYECPDCGLWHADDHCSDHAEIVLGPCISCARLRMALFEGGLDPDRVMCAIDDDRVCTVGMGTGDEGLPIDEVERIINKALTLVHGGESHG